MEKKCKICGKKFRIHPCEKERKYCSYKCYWNSIRGKEIPTRQKRVEIKCLICGKNFKRFQYRINRKYCSRKCYDQSKKPIEINCEFCGKKFNVIPSRKDRNSVHLDVVEDLGLKEYHTNGIKLGQFVATVGKNSKCGPVKRLLGGIVLKNVTGITEEVSM